MKLIRYQNPAFDELDKLIALNLPPFGKRSELGSYFEKTPSQTRQPATRLHEDEQNYYAALEIPGIRKENINLSVEKSVLTLSAENKEEENERSRNYSVKTSFTLPEDIETQNIKAELDHGVLTITLPKGKEAKPLKIKIN